MEYVELLRKRHMSLTNDEINSLVKEARDKFRMCLILGIKSYSKANDSIVDMVSDRIGTPTFLFPFTTVTSPSSYLSHISTALDTFSIYDSSVRERVEVELEKSVESSFLSDFDFKTRIEYDFLDGSKKIDKDSGCVKKIVRTPKSTILDPIWYSHEGIHACKDVFYDEYIDALSYADVISIFHELVASNKLGGDVQQQWLAARYYLLHSSKFERDLFSIEKNARPNYKNEFDLLKNLSSSYLLDYYYAILLFQMYKKNPDKVIDGINNVLCGKTTTKELLEQFGLLEHSSSQFRTFEKENSKYLQKVKSYYIKHKK